MDTIAFIVRSGSAFIKDKVVSRPYSFDRTPSRGMELDFADLEHTLTVEWVALNMEEQTLSVWCEDDRRIEEEFYAQSDRLAAIEMARFYWQQHGWTVDDSEE